MKHCPARNIFCPTIHPPPSTMKKGKKTENRKKYRKIESERERQREIEMKNKT